MELVITPLEDLDSFFSPRITAAVEKAHLAFESEKKVSIGWMRDREASELLGSRATRQRLRKSGRLPYSKVGQLIFYRIADIERLLENNIQTPEKGIEG